MNLRTYLMIKQANIVYKPKPKYDPVINTISPNGSPEDREIAIGLHDLWANYGLPHHENDIAELQRKFGPKGMLLPNDDSYKFGKKPVSVAPGIGPTPLGFNYGK